MKNAKGFTLVELIIVIIIVGILSIVAVPVYRGYTKKAMGTEAKSLLGAVATAEKVYYAEYDHFYALGGDPAGDVTTAAKAKAFDTQLDVDVRGNKYFTSYGIAITGDGNGAVFTAVTSGVPSSGADKISLTLVSASTGQPVLTENYGDGVTE